jgi:anti-sigma-K factor RskA
LNEQQHYEEDMVGAYALDALEGDELEAFEAHLPACASCRAEVAELRQVVDVLPLAVERVEPPVDLRARILRDATGDGPHALAVLPGGRDDPSRATRARRFPQLDQRTTLFALAAAAVLVLALGVWNVALQTGGGGSTPTADYRPVLAALTSGASVSPVAPTSAGFRAHAALIQPRHARTAYFVVTDLPKAPTDEVYQLWLMRGPPTPQAKPVSAGVFSSSGTGTQVVKLPISSRGYTLTAVTVEHGPNGSRGPTTKPILLGRLTA